MTSILHGRHFPGSYSKRRADLDTGKRKGNTGVTLEILLLWRGSLKKRKKKEKRGERRKKKKKQDRPPVERVPAQGIPPAPYFSPRIFARPPRSILRVPGERRDGTRCAFRIARPSPHRRTVRRHRHRSASCTYLPGTCTTLFTTRSYTPSLPHGAIVLKIKKCVSGSEGKKLGSLGVVVALSGPGERYSPFFRPPSRFSSFSSSLSPFLSSRIVSYPLAHPTGGANPRPVNV